jgi:endonuclease/exonuclease/phosphatase (EEP) superfamily protein YafD
MRDPGTDQPAAATEPNKGDPLSPALLAARVAMLVSDEAGLRGGELPIWDRFEQRPPRRIRRSRLAFAAAWCVTIGLLFVAVLRMLCHDATVLLTWFNAFTLYVYLPAYLVLLFAAWTERWWLAAASVAVVACHLAWVLPDFRPAAPYAPPVTVAAEHLPRIRIFYANVRGGSNMDMDSVLAEALQGDPDVIVLAEMQRWWWHEMIDRNPLKTYPYGTDLQRRNAGDIGVFSRLPVRRMEQILVESRTSLVIDVSLGAETLRLVALHSPRPMRHMNDDYYNFWQKMEPILDEQRGPVVVLGDFNATQHSRVYKQLKADGMRSAHEDRGRGYATTWPNGKQPIPPIRIDQAFLSPSVECISIDEGVGRESDHKPLLLDLRIHQTGPIGAAR